MINAFDVPRFESTESRLTDPPPRKLSSSIVLDPYGHQLLGYGRNSAKLISGWFGDAKIDSSAAEAILEEGCAVLETDPASGSLCDTWIGSLIVIIYDYWESSTIDENISYRYHESYERATYALICMMSTTKVARQTISTIIRLRLLGELTRVLGEIVLDDISYITQVSIIKFLCRVGCQRIL
jgi:hypothetical protein